MHKLLKRVVEAIQEKLKMSVLATRTESSACDEKSETELERKYNSEFRETLVSLERKLHTTEDPSAITMEALKMVCAFHDADWAGILIVDRSAEMWSPAMWYDPELGEMGPTLFYEEEYFENFQRWVQALRTADPAFSQLLDAILQPGLVCFLGAQRIILARVQKETLRLDDDCRQLKIHPISPITVYRTLPNRHTYYYNPLDNEFSQLVNENYHRKWKSAVGELPKDSVELIALSVGRRDKVVTRVKGTIINAWGGTYLLKGNSRALEFLYHTGLGAKNSMGFGAFEILR